MDQTNIQGQILYYNQMERSCKLYLSQIQILIF
jgi:hypothetical protein